MYDVGPIGANTNELFSRSSVSGYQTVYSKFMEYHLSILCVVLTKCPWSGLPEKCDGGLWGGIRKFKDIISGSCVWLSGVIFEPVYFFRV